MPRGPRSGARHAIMATPRGVRGVGTSNGPSAETGARHRQFQFLSKFALRPGFCQATAPVLPPFVRVPWYQFVCLWQRLLASHPCTF